MYQVKAVCNAGSRFYMPFHFLVVFVCACIQCGDRHRHKPPLITTPHDALTLAASGLTSMQPRAYKCGNFDETVVLLYWACF